MHEPVGGFHGTSTCSIRVKSVHGVGLHVVVGGELDHHTAGTFELVIEECLAERRPIALDLSGVSFADGRGLDAVLRARRRADVPINVIATSPCVDRVLALAGHRPLLAERRVG
jgi:anti-anti-sigma factor